MKKNKFILNIILCVLCLQCSSDERNNTLIDLTNNDTPSDNSAWIFVANEGTFDINGPTNTGTISMIDSYGNIYETESLGDIVHSLAVHNNKLIVAVNNSQKILLFDISSQGISNKTEISTKDNLSPREIVIVNNKAYFGTWNPEYNIYANEAGKIQVLNLESLEIEATINVGIMPEGLLLFDNYIWVANSGESTISKIDVSSNIVTETINVGPGPQNLINHNNEIYISRTFYDTAWNTFHGSSKIAQDLNISTNTYGLGAPCGGSVMVYENKVFRSYEGGIAPLDSELNINTSARIGNYTQEDIYHVEIINNHIWISIENNNDPGEIKVIDSNGLELNTYSVGINPGDFASWIK